MRRPSLPSIFVMLACGAALLAAGAGARGRRPPRAAAPPAAAHGASAPEAATRYERRDWPHWIDADRDCQNTREELLIAESLRPVTFKGRRPCQVLSGLWRDAYTGELVGNPGKLDVDHLVPLAEAYRSGGFRWPEWKRRAFANDLDNLALTRATLNRSKGDQDPASWLPPNPALRCDYARRWRHIKQRWGLELDTAEHAALVPLCH